LFDYSDLLVISIAKNYKKFYRFHLLFDWDTDYTDFSGFALVKIISH